ncbi:MAG: glycosyltransferase [Myxococcales bacterium]|nr:glycosyltransferase [Myxococcales bacterium]
MTSARAFWVVVQTLATIVFVNRYIGGLVLRVVRGDRWDETVDDFEPTVTVIIPLYNEGQAIRETLASVLASDYPGHKLRVTCIDDCSTDDSYDVACEVARSDPRLTVLRNARNSGKRHSINEAVQRTDSEIIVSVDSDVIIDRNAIRELVRRFTIPQIAAVGGWVDVRNKHDNWLTRMQVVRYWYAYNISRGLECGFRRVMCLSGCLTAYRRSVLLELAPILGRRAILGVPIKYGEDRYLTRQIVKAGYLTVATLAARCRTFVPNTLTGFFSQQLRWRRSRIVDYSGACSHVWRLNPLLAVHYFSLALLIVVYPIGAAHLLATHGFLRAITIHIVLLVVYGSFYRWRVRRLAPSDRVGMFSYAPIAVVLPITFALMTPLAMFTLDSSDWGTRDKT